MKVQAPGRICLFGEHQDYLGLSIIAQAIDRVFIIESKAISQKKLILKMPDIGKTEEILLQFPLSYQNNRDYLRAGLNIFERTGFKLQSGFEFTLTSTIPFQAGCSSSSAMCVAWSKTLAELTNHPQKNNREWIAKTAFQMEVAEFEEAGGMMDHYTSSFGGTIFIDFEDTHNPQYEILNVELTGLLLGDSLQKKETVETIRSHKALCLSALKKLQKKSSQFTFQNLILKDCEKYSSILLPEELNRIKATLINRNVCREAYQVLKSVHIHFERVAELLNIQHQTINDLMNLSTPTINHLLQTSFKAGALSGKVNGSGGGGTFIIYAPHKEESVLLELKKQGAQAFKIKSSPGVSVVK
ncbi:MAG: hypothetical protein HYW47_04595 [Deltaproteobacteria bacterium]|nr:hypothetical protein [Deltaproteobacteria bacterium]